MRSPRVLAFAGLVIAIFGIAFVAVVAGAQGVGPSGACSANSSCSVGSLTTTSTPLSSSGLSGTTSVRLGSYSSTEAAAYLGKATPGTANFSFLGDTSGNTYVNGSNSGALRLAFGGSSVVDMPSTTQMYPHSNNVLSLGILANRFSDGFFQKIRVDSTGSVCWDLGCAANITNSSGTLAVNGPMSMTLGTFSSGVKMGSSGTTITDSRTCNSGVLDFGTVPARTCSELTFTCTGVTSTSPLASTWNVFLGASFGFMANVRASASDTVAVDVCNVTNAAADAPPATYYVRFF